MNKKKLAKIIELVTIGVIVLVVAIIALTTIIPSYTAWKEDYDAIIAGNVKPPKKVLESIEAKLVDGKVYYDNNLAAVKSDDLIVTANYMTGEDASSETVEASDYEISVPADFAANGGDITVKYKQKTAVVAIELVPVVLVELEMTQSPYTIAYKTGEKFSYDGMKINAVFNDGSKKAITSAEYVTDIVTPLENGATTHKVTYTDGDETVEYDVPITVSDSFSNGRVVSISAAEECYVEAGADLSEVRPLVKRTYTSGNSEVTNDYTVSNDPETVMFGKEYVLSLAYKGDPRIKADVPVTVRNHVEGEDTNIVGGKKSSEASYTFEKGQFVATGETPSFAGAFANAVKSGKDAYISFSVESYTDCVADITLNCGNSYITKDNAGYYWMQPLQINTILDMTVNGEPVAIGNNVVLKGCGPSETNGTSSSAYAPLYGVYYQFTFEDVKLIAGANIVKLEFKMSTEGAVTCWNESPSTMNIDWINIDTKGTTVDENATITGLEVSPNYEIEYGDDINEVLAAIPVTAIMSDGTRRKVDGSLYTVTVTQGETASGTFKNGDYTLTATLNSDSAVTASQDFTISYFYTLVRRAYLELDETAGKVWYVFEFDNVGYTGDDYGFFGDDKDWEAEITIDGEKLTAKIDATEFKAGTHSPHARVGNSNYVNGANSNGDIRGSELEYTNGETLTFGNRTYTIKTNWSMPALVIAEIAAE